MEDKVWFITGASRGFGRIWAEAALTRGDRVAATARKVEDLADLRDRFGDAVLPLSLDVTDTEQVQHVVDEAHAHFGRLDVVLNNAGYTLVGTVEEASDADIRAVFDTNFFGAVHVVQAALPYLREQGSGHIVTVSSSLGIGPMPLIGFYCATKAAVESIHESLAPEVKGFGIKVTLIEPGAYATDFASPTSLKMAPGMDTYADLRARVFGGLASEERGDPQATTEAILSVVDSEEPPLRFASGRPCCLWRAPSTPAVSLRGKRGRASRTPHKANRKSVPSTGPPRPARERTSLDDVGLVSAAQAGSQWWYDTTPRHHPPPRAHRSGGLLARPGLHGPVRCVGPHRRRDRRAGHLRLSRRTAAPFWTPATSTAAA